MTDTARTPASAVDVLIVGAGAAGLAAARRLQAVRPDLTLQVVEAGGRIGGRAYTVTADGLPLDLGCGWLHGARDNAWTAIAGSLGFAIDHGLATWDGAPRNLGLPPSDERAASEALRTFLRGADSRGRDAPDEPLSNLLDPGSRWNGFIEAIGTFINGTELEQASRIDYDRYEPGRGPDARVVEGYGALIAAFGAELPVVCDTAVQAIDHGSTPIRIETSRGVLRARVVLVTVSTAVLAADAIRFTPALPAKAEAAHDLPLGLANKLFLALPDDDRFAPDSYLMGSAERARTASYHVRPFGRPLVECYFGGALARDLEQGGIEATTGFARAELASHWGAAATRHLRPLGGSAWLGRPFISGSYSFARPGAWGQRAVLAAPVDDRLFFAGEACSPHRFSTAHGAYETGIAEADRIAAALL